MNATRRLPSGDVEIASGGSQPWRMSQLLTFEVLKDNSRPDAGAVYEALAMPFAVLVGQIAKVYGK